jgi:hypothetical protein
VHRLPTATKTDIAYRRVHTPTQHWPKRTIALLSSTPYHPIRVVQKLPDISLGKMQTVARAFGGNTQFLYACRLAQPRPILFDFAILQVDRGNAATRYRPQSPRCHRHPRYRRRQRRHRYHLAQRPRSFLVPCCATRLVCAWGCCCACQ